MTLTGHDLEALGLRKGPAYSRILAAIFKSKLDGMVTTDEDEYRLAKSLIAQETHTSQSTQR